MYQDHFPELPQSATSPGIRGIAILAAVESAARAVLASVFPIVLYKTYGDARAVSEVYLVIGIAAFILALMCPGISRTIPRRWFYTLGVVGIVTGAVLASMGGVWFVGLGLALFSLFSVVVAICFNAYVMDYVKRHNLGELEAKRQFYGGASWAIGPFLGVWLMDQWPPAPFVVAGIMGIIQMSVFWFLRLGDGKVFTKASQSSANPLVYLPRFFAQPRLVAGWSFTLARACAWRVYFIYVPIFVVDSGYSHQLGGLTVSIANGFMFITPLMFRWIQARSIRQAVLTGFACSGALFCVVPLVAAVPPLALGVLILVSFFLVLLSVCGGLPFLMAVKPSERTEMSAVYAMYRDVSGVVAPGVVRGVLAVATLPAAFAVMGIGLFAMIPLALRLHKRLGAKRMARTKA